jgi:heat shock protein 4
LYEDGEDTTKAAYQGKLDEIRDLVKPFEDTIKEERLQAQEEEFARKRAEEAAKREAEERAKKAAEAAMNFEERNDTQMKDAPAEGDKQ